MNNLILKEIYRTALLCKLSQLNPSDINNNDATFSNIRKIIIDNNMNFIINDKLKCYMFNYNNTIFIVFYSTIIYKKPMIKFKDKIKINKDIFLIYNTIHDNLIKYINDYNKDKNIKKIYVCGYNIGGTFATVASAILAEKFKHMYLISCYTFGSLKAGNRHFCNYFNENITCNYRIWIEDDTHISNTWKCYKHVSNYLQLENDNIIEKPELNSNHCIKKFLCCCYYVSTYDNIISIDTYLDKFNNILSAYNLNIRSKQYIPSPSLRKDDMDSTSSTISSYPPSYGIINSNNSSKNNSPITEDLSNLIIKKIQNVDKIVSKLIDTKRTNSIKSPSMNIKDIVLQMNHI